MSHEQIRVAEVPAKFKALAIDLNSFGLEDPGSDPVCGGGFRLESDPAYAAAQAVDEGSTTLHEPRRSSPFAGASKIGADIFDVSDSHILRKSISERLVEFSTSVSTWCDLTARPALVSLVETVRPFAIEAWTHGPSVLRHAALGTLRTVESVSRSVRGWLDDEEEEEGESIRLFFSEEAFGKFGNIKDLVLVTSGPTEAGGSELHFSNHQSQETSRYVDIDGPRPDSDNTSTSPAWNSGSGCPASI